MEIDVGSIQRSDLGLNESIVPACSAMRETILDRADLVRSGGPWLVVPSLGAIFDGINAGHGLGYNSGPLFGVAQYAGAWTGDWTDEHVQAVECSLNGLIARSASYEIPLGDRSTPRHLIRSYIAAHVLEQFSDSSLNWASPIGQELTQAARIHLRGRAPEFLNLIQFEDRNMSIDFRHSRTRPIVRLWEHGILAQELGDAGVRIRIPLSATSSDLKWLVQKIITIWQEDSHSLHPGKIQLRDYLHYYDFHWHLIRCKQLTAQGKPPTVSDVISFLQSFMPPELKDVAQLQYLTTDIWPQYREAVERMQRMVYEPARQTSLTTFDTLFQDPFGFGLLVGVDREIAGIACAGPLVLFPNERGTLDDPSRGDRHVLYPLDLTVADQYRGSLGTYLKRGMVLLALASGHHAFHGRNRDRLAAAMWAINLSLGSYQTRHLPDDYPDQGEHRDCIYYCCPIRWSRIVKETNGLEQDWVDPVEKRRRLSEFVHR